MGHGQANTAILFMMRGGQNRNGPSRVYVPEDSLADNCKVRRKSAVKFRIVNWNVRTMLEQVPNLEAVHTSSRSRHTPP